jgi:hypothetical protein
LFPTVGEKALLGRNDTVNTQSYEGALITEITPSTRLNVTR